MSRATRITLTCAGTVFAAMLVTLVAGIRNLDRPVRWSPETAPLRSITAINTAQVQYYSSLGHYAASLRELGPAANGTGGFIERDLASGEKVGYKFTVAPTPTGYTVTAVPSQYPTSGSVTYFSDQSMRIHVHKGQEPATVNDPLLGEAVAAQQSK